MKNKIISLVAILTMLSNTAFADCDFSKGVTANPDGTRTYTKECHIAVGNLVQDNAVKTQQVQDLNQAITLKDLAITKSDQRAQNWMDTSLKLEENVQKMDSLKKENEWIYFALGVLATGMAGIAAAQLSRSK